MTLGGALAGFGISLWLLALRFLDPDSLVAGCGGGLCDEVLGSRWAVAMGLPVAAWGVLMWAGPVAATVTRHRCVVLPMVSTIFGAGLWFTFVQAVFLGAFCPWCMAHHAVALALLLWVISDGGARSRRHRVAVAGSWAAAGLLGIGLVQVYGPHPTTRVTTWTSDGDNPDDPSREQDGRVVSFAGGRLRFRVADHPVWGDPDAGTLLVECFDYQCPACVTMAGHLEALVAKHPADVAVLLVPVPLERSCNPGVPPADEHPGSCEIAAIALAVHRVAPERFAGFHRSLIANPSVARARSLAEDVIGAERLDSGLAGPPVPERIRANVAVYQDLSRSNRKLPKLLIRGSRVLHGLPSGRADFIRVMEGELGL